MALNLACRSPKKFLLLGLEVSLIFSALACTTPPVVENPMVTASDRSLERILASESPPGCRKMIDSYCGALHSPEIQGNLLIGDGATALPVFQGVTKNDFSSAYFLYARAKIRAASELPSDFKRALDSQDYFGNLTRALGRRPRSEMNLDARMRSMRRDFELTKIWNTALSETILHRMEVRFPGFHRIREDLIPLEQSVERIRVRRELISEISRAIWKHDPNWSKVVAGFETLRKHFLVVIDRLDIPEALRRDWSERIAAVKLVIPGAIPAIADTECSTTQLNAFYYSHLNLITVCAGDFNSEDIFQTVAHELAHSLDLSRTRYLFQKKSALGQGLARLRREVCAAPAFSCDSWGRFKAEYRAQLGELGAFQPPVPEFQKCLQRREIQKTISASDIQRLAERIINDQVSELAQEGTFLRLTKERIPLPNGKKTLNPNYLNPCSYRIWSQGEEPIDDDLNQLVFFTAEWTATNIMALMVGLFLVMLIATVRASFQNTIVTWLEEILKADIVLTSSGRSITASVQPVREEIQDEVLKVPGVRDPGPGRGTRSRFVQLNAEGKTFVLKAFDEPGEFVNYANMKIKGRDRVEAGRELYDSVRNAREPGIFVSENYFLQHPEKKVGDLLEIDTPSGRIGFRILAVCIDFASANGVFYMSREVYKRYWKDSLVTAFALSLEPGADLETVRSEIARRVGRKYNLISLSNAEMRSEMKNAIDETFNYTRAVEGAALLVALLGLLNTLLISVLERTREIGVMRAIGSTRSQVFRMILGEALIQGGLGAIVAVAIGGWIGKIWIEYSLAHALGWMIEFSMPIESILKTVLIGTAVAVIAGLYPARRAADLAIVEALEYE